MDLALWIAAGVLGGVALLGGSTKTFLPLAKLQAHDGGQWTSHASPVLIRTLGVLELLAAVGLILPAVLDIAPVVVPITAACWIVLMVGAMLTHLRFRQVGLAVLCVGYLAVAAFVAWGRFGPESFSA